MCILLHNIMFHVYLQDEGVVTSSVTGADGSSFLVVLDAASFEEIARVTLPYTVAYGFHNQFFPA